MQTAGASKTLNKIQQMFESLMGKKKPSKKRPSRKPAAASKGRSSKKK